MSTFIVGLDIGTSFIRCAIGELNEENKVEIIGLAKSPSQGLRNGVIVNIDAAMNVIKETVEAAEQAAGVEVTSVYTAIGGAQIESINSKGQIGVDQSGKNRSLEISKSAKDRVIEASKFFPISPDKKLIHVIPQEYIIDGTPGFKNPIGIMGVRLEVCAHLVTASVTALSNIDQCIRRAGYERRYTMLKTLAEVDACMYEDEMEVGSILIDLGGGTTDVIVLNKGAPVFTASIPVGGNMVTNDISVVKSISNATAEKIKIENGCCWILGNEKEEEVIIPGVGGKPPEQTTRYELCEIIQPRVEEIMKMVKKEVVRRSNLTKLSGSIVLTGGGALMPGIVELTQSVWGTTSVRIGGAPELGGTDTSYRDADYATVVGLVLANKNADKSEKMHHKIQKDGNSSENDKMEKIKKFIKNFF